MAVLCGWRPRLPSHRRLVQTALRFFLRQNQEPEIFLSQSLLLFFSCQNPPSKPCFSNFLVAPAPTFTPNASVFGHRLFFPTVISENPPVLLRGVGKKFVCICQIGYWPVLTTEQQNSIPPLLSSHPSSFLSKMKAVATNCEAPIGAAATSENYTGSAIPI
jgi:hypothetical protein